MTSAPTREQAVEEFAEVFGLTVADPPTNSILKGGKGWWGWARVPAATAPLHEHFAFIGRLVEILRTRTLAVQRLESDALDAWRQDPWEVTFDADWDSGTAADPTWAALRAAVRPK